MVVDMSPFDILLVLFVATGTLTLSYLRIIGWTNSRSSKKEDK